MKYTTLGASRLEVSRLCLGTMNLGRHADTDASHAILDEAHTMGINYIDTANRYGTADRPNAAEEIIGEWFAKGGGRRERTVLATKVFEQTDPWPNNEGLSALNIRRACDASLRRLRTDHIDVYQMHHVDRRAPWDEIWEAFELLRSQGKIIYRGTPYARSTPFARFGDRYRTVLRCSDPPRSTVARPRHRARGVRMVSEVRPSASGSDFLHVSSGLRLRTSSDQLI